jgi:hypothetical protein
MKCIVCSGEFESKRSDAKYCSDKCRKELSRTKPVVTDKSVRDNVTDNFCCFPEYAIINRDYECGCGERLHAVLKPIGRHEVVMKQSTRYLFSYFDKYVPEVMR